MDIQTIDNQYNQLQSQAQQTMMELQALARKLQGAAQAGDQNAREWFLDLKSIALAIQAEQIRLPICCRHCTALSPIRRSKCPSRRGEMLRPIRRSLLIRRSQPIRLILSRAAESLAGF